MQLLEKLKTNLGLIVLIVWGLSCILDTSSLFYGGRNIQVAVEHYVIIAILILVVLFRIKVAVLLLQVYRAILIFEYIVLIAIWLKAPQARPHAALVYVEAFLPGLLLIAYLSGLESERRKLRLVDHRTS